MRNIEKRTKRILKTPILAVPETEECHVQQEHLFKDFMSSVIEQLELQGRSRCVET